MSEWTNGAWHGFGLGLLAAIALRWGKELRELIDYLRRNRD